jgi:hypothetical protein
MKFKLIPIEESDLPVFKKDMQESFKIGAMAWEEDMEESAFLH